MQSKLHILWVNEVADDIGGCEKYIYETVDLLKQQGIKNTFLYGVDGWTSPKMTKIFDAAFPLVDIPRQLKEISPDIVYIHRLSGVQKLQLFLKHHNKVVRFFHDHKLFCLREHKYKTLGSQTCTSPTGLGCYPCLGFISKADNFCKIKVNSLRKLHQEQKVNQQLQGVVVGSEYMKNHLMVHRFDQEKIHVVPLFKSLPEEQNMTRKANALLFVGQLIRGKGLDVLLQAIQKCPEVNLKIVGSGKQEQLYKEMAASLQIENQVEFLGKQNSLASYYCEATAVIIPSRAPETFCLVGIEAMSYKTPVIATAVGGMGQWLQDGKTGISVPSNDVASLATAIQKLVSDQSLQESLGEAGQNFYRENFLPEHHLEKLQTLFLNLCGR